MKSTGKNFIIAFLMVLAIYQTAELWFEDFSGHNFFSFAGNTAAFDDKKDTDYTLKRVIINTGENKMLNCGVNVYRSSCKSISDDALSKLLRRGEVISEGTADWHSILQSKCFVMEYGYSMGRNEAESFFGVSNGNTAKIKSFDTVILASDSDRARLIFLNSETMWSIEFMMNDNSTASNISKLFRFAEQESNIYLISSVQNGFEIFRNNVFISRWDGQKTKYYRAVPKLQYEQEDKEALESEVNLFFDNPAGKWSSSVNGILNYSDESTVVKYYPTGVMEYSNYSAVKQNAENDFYTNYTACLDMLERDSGIKNEIYLKDYRLEDGQYVMYFGCKLNNIPVYMDESLKTAVGMEDYIELYASSGRVSRYRRYCCAYELDSSKAGTASRDFLSAVDDVYSTLEAADETTVDDISLSYADNGSGEVMHLAWIVDIGDAQYVRDTEATDA